MYDRILSQFYATPWAILPEKHLEIQAFLHLKAAGKEVPEFQAVEPRRAAVVNGSIAVIPIFGTISKRMNMMSAMSGGTSLDSMMRTYRSALADSEIKAIVFHGDTPGGTVPGVPEAFDEIYKNRGAKPTEAVADGEGVASAGMWVMRACETFSASPSTPVGSIGVFAAHQNTAGMQAAMGIETKLFVADISPRKAEFNSYGPLTAEAADELQRVCNELGAQFVDAMAKGAGVTAHRVRQDFGQGRMMSSTAAKGVGMIDRIATIEGTLRRMLGRGGSRSSASASRAALDVVPMYAEETEEPDITIEERPYVVSASMAAEIMAETKPAEATESMVPCPDCNGTGKMDDGSDCPTCDGTGMTCGDDMEAKRSAAVAEESEVEAGEGTAVLEELNRRELDLRIALLG
jgi:ClpP class serine protease